ncbi:MAG TPA: M64 family metallopeptidase [Gallionella sp.]|nr:M64 family metallopeptidase [Gallionella sp.]
MDNPNPITNANVSPINHAVMIRFVAFLLIGGLVLSGMSSVFAASTQDMTVKPLRIEKGTPVYSNRTLRIAVDVHRDGASIIQFTYHDRKFIRRDNETLPTLKEDGPTRLLFSIRDAKGRFFQIEKEVPGLCLRHGADEPPHIMGDTIELHRDSVIVELPAIDGAQSIEVRHRHDPKKEPRLLTVEAFDKAKYVPSNSKKFEDLNFALTSKGKLKKAKGKPTPPEAEGAPAPTNGTVTWPTPPDPNYKVWGNVDQVNSRINVVIVPDGYQTTEKAIMETHAQELVNAFRATTPFTEHDTFFNYILVYAYSTNSGTTQCDCNKMENTAMATFFPNTNPACGNDENRCLYYGGGCNPASVDNISAAELRAPAHDVTIVMVNTPRYGGCGGSRAVYSAGNASAKLIGIHELGHSLGGLADEYAYTNTCGTSAGEKNTSLNATQGSWPEWIGDIGAPRQGAQYFQQCVYRPEDNCMMRELGPPFCHVCNQLWALKIFGKLGSTAPITTAVPNPQAPISTTVNTPITLGITTHFPISTANNSVVWSVAGGNTSCVNPAPPSGNNIYAMTFSCAGTYNVMVTATADRAFVKSQKDGANKKTITWQVNVTQ